MTPLVRVPSLAAHSHLSLPPMATSKQHLRNKQVHCRQLLPCLLLTSHVLVSWLFVELLNRLLAATPNIYLRDQLPPPQGQVSNRSQDLGSNSLGVSWFSSVHFQDVDAKGGGDSWILSLSLPPWELINGWGCLLL